MTISPITNEEGVCEGYIGVHRDVTAEREAERKIQEANVQLAVTRDQALEASQAKSRFLANMSHELRTPMNAIIGYSEILLEEFEEIGQKEVIPDLENIHSAGKHLLQLINDILDLSKIEAGKMEIHIESFKLDKLIEEVANTIAPMAQKNENELKIVCQPNLGEIMADPVRLRQTLLNLLSNACKFTQKGTVQLIVTRARRAGDSLDWLSFEVVDSGVGMDDDQLNRLFDEFTQVHSTRKYGGTGLGLAISRRFCRMMGGDISVKSKIGEGSTFTIRIPERVVSPTDRTNRRRTSDSPSI